MKLLSPAKVNLFLKIVGKRPDGYHELISLFQTISLSDTLTLEESQEDLLTCSDPKIPLDASNTVSKALTLFRAQTKIDIPVKIHIEKRIPHGAGLGGGSSNAATILFGLNQLFNTPLSTKKLHEIGQEVGSDVPFFFSGGAAICKGRGEIVEPFSKPFSGPLFIVMPPFSLSTKDVYQTLKSSSLKERIIKEDPIEFFNDLEEPAFALNPKLKEFKDALSIDNTPVFMTGSGSALVKLGGEAPAPIEGCSIYPAEFISRKDELWYLH